jgi:hypothetical protein
MKFGVNLTTAGTTFAVLHIMIFGFQKSIYVIMQFFDVWMDLYAIFAQLPGMCIISLTLFSILWMISS